ncbi:phosphoribosylanthranilate isomerase [Candidatus Methanoperedens nitroreducens]|uniref:N-(5'-phosphoribosyl)anthranilate isomerase n=1 Tax=Candidatus Methanoperedens nitratireducens TaxID=1392998 RepID=A0A062V7Z9_9EURY|nr:phosphoribosylanthranilate isomerase [Candidatus Methanoperedens nitroreducens]KCZ71889.1 phosphoribosylanthranilate isomerase [Candidatus Methanoperedens nitroreducens]MDJ1422138.1 phosphoribosylanthranilate isomerase [Candidatus Methanoperedens sp.]
MKVKICGIKTERDLVTAIDSGADAVGFITEVPVDSPRKISLVEASRLISKVPVFITSVLVIMPENAERAIRMIGTARPTAVQVHNALALSELKKIKEAGVKLIKTIPVPGNADPEMLIEQVNELKGIADAVLLDTVLDGRTGGTGAVHNWKVSSEVVLHAGMPVILAGGLNPENVGDAVMSVRPYAVDTASGVETDGIKDQKKVVAFINNARMHGI